MNEEKIVSVAVPRPVTGFFVYSVPQEMESLVHRGAWVKVPFGKSRLIGYVVGDPRSRDQIPEGLDPAKLRSIEEVSPEGLAIPEEVLKLAEWASNYYQAPLGEVLSSAAPTAAIGAKRGGEGRKRKKAPELDPGAEFALTEGALEKPPVSLTEDQLAALQAIRDAGTKPVLLHGVTGSGKTEVYIELAREALARGEGVLLLVPEIALTPQLHARFEAGLGRKVEAWHSAMPDLVRQEKWQAIRSAASPVVVGARSAVFAPIPNLGLVIVDEEHEPAYKQEDRARYHARDLAVVRGKLENARVVLGSATPSLETRERVREGRYAIARLPNRIATSPKPKIEILDLAEAELVSGTQAPIAASTLEALRETLARGEQAMMFLNRRGFAAFLLCEECGEVPGCPNCSISLTVHRRERALRCHVCGHREPAPVACAKCEGIKLREMGAGTESLEHDLPKLLPDARVQRLDRDQVTSATRLEKILEGFRRGETNLLLGTQMLVKGHDFPGVTLVVVVLADGLFRWPDFRASERASQVLTQVSGRAGRGDLPGRVILQTYVPDHPVLLSLSGKESEERFLEGEREARKALGYPPFSRIARLRVERADANQARDEAKALATLLGEGNGNVDLLGPSEAFLERAKGVTRWDLLLKSPSIEPLSAKLRIARLWAENGKVPLVVDVDPHGLG